MKHTNKTVLGTGLKYLAGAIPLSVIGPVVLFSAFNNQDHPWYFPVLLIGIAAGVAAVFFMFKGIMTIMKALFD